jgi:catechol 2,3-dioxygenase-like lactoylglutathione lyase family enzyme
MSKEKSVHSVKFGRTAPGIPVTDIHRSVQFYTEVLGMEKVFENGSPIGFVILVRDEAEIHLTLTKNHVATDRNLVHLMVTDAKSLYDHLEKNGVRIVKGLREADYGLRQFVFADPDGNRIDVGEDI